QSDIIIKAFNVEITRADVQTLKPRQWLNDEIINMYCQMVMKRCKSNPERYPAVHCFNTFFYKFMCDTGYNAVRKWTKKIDIFALDAVIIPVHLGMHWCCAIINIAKKRFEYYDSMHGGPGSCLQTLRKYLTAEHLDKKRSPIDLSSWTDYSPRDIPAQENGFDCGVFTCMWMEYASRREPFDFSQTNMPYLRQRIVAEILQSQLMCE
ncbi:hypothetical protein BDK51DRAFT_23192, partial [Blyttiomyces helicus]